LVIQYACSICTNDHVHHIDHIGGLRAFAAAGATIVVGKGDGAFYHKVLSAPETLNPYGTKQVPPKVEEVDGKWSTTEGGRMPLRAPLRRRASCLLWHR
jgi:glyoxylase-like metal-dependent hydrolase (beta-lactamase superfamily II)